MNRQIALISEHASPLSVLGGVDCGGQNLYVGQVAKALAGLGYDVDVFTRRDSEVLPETAEWVDGVRIVHVPAGPPRFVRKEELLPYMQEFTDYVARFCKCQRKAYDMVHANFWMSGLVAAEVKRLLGTPFVITFHALGRVRRQHQRQADEFPDERFTIEDRIIAEADHLVAEAPQDEEDLIRLYNADPAKITIVPCGFDPTELWPISKPIARISLGLRPEERVILHVGRMVPRKGIDTIIRGFSGLVHRHQVVARLLIVGGESDDPDPLVTPEIGRLRQIALEEGVAEHVTFVGRRGRDQLKYYYSAADAEYLAASFERSFRPGLPAFYLNATQDVLNADPDPDYGLARRIHLFGQPGDVLVAISADEPVSPLAHALMAAQERGLRSIAILGRNGTDVGREADVALHVPSDHRHSVEELHVLLMHLLTALVDRHLEASDRVPSGSSGVRSIWELPRRSKTRTTRHERIALPRTAGK